MGSQQLLIIAIAAVVLAVAVAVGVTMFRDQAASSNRDELAMDLSQFAVRAQAYYRRPTTLGGGGGSFGGLQMQYLTTRTTNLNGSYTLDPTPVPNGAMFVKIQGIGTEVAEDGLPVKVVMKVYADSMLTLDAEGH
jgi:Tfp pilus assembly protein FimT